MSERLDAIKSLIVRADVIADVGCDHGRIAEYCANGGLCREVIASDISDKCLDKARARLDNADNVKFIACDGIDYECDEAIIAGMGGLTVANILRAARSLPQTVVACPHRDADAVRKTLLELGYGIDRDEYVEEHGKFYTVMRAIRDGGVRRLDELQILFGAFADVPNTVLQNRLKKLYDTYMLAEEQNSVRLKQVKAAMALQRITI